MRSKALACALLGLLLFGLDGSANEVAGQGLSTFFCPATEVEGSFEPTQGVWQDAPTFADGPGRRLTRIEGRGHPAYRAELPMVRGRPTMLFGVDRVADEVPINSRMNFVLKGIGHGAMTGLGFPYEFTKTDATGTTELARGGIGPLPVIRGGGDCTGPNTTPFEISMPVFFRAAPGTPVVAPFTFDAAGFYTLTWEVGLGFRDNLKVTVEGTVVETENLNISIVPVILPDINPLTGIMTSVPADSPSIAQLQAFANRVESDTRNYLGDFFPLLPPFHPVVSQPPRVWDLTRIFREAERIVKARSPGISALDLNAQRATTARGLVNRRLANTATPSGLDRIIVVMLESDFQTLRRASGVAATTFNQKVAYVPSGVLRWKFEPIHTVAHELGHTMPYSWGAAQMDAECGQDYHNDYLMSVAYGYRMLRGGVFVADADSLISAAQSFMGPALRMTDTREAWVDQCTYANLVKELQAVPDPPVILVSGLLRREGGAISGDLFPLYQLDSTVGLESGGEGDMTIVLRDTNAAELGRYPFAAIWDVPHGPPLDLIAFSHTVPDLPGVARIDLEGPAGLLDSLR